MTHILRPARFGGAARAPESLEDLIANNWDYDPTHPNAQDFDVLAIMGDTGKRQVLRIDTATKTVIDEISPGVWGGSSYGTIDGQPYGILCNSATDYVHVNFHPSQYSRFNDNKAARICGQIYVGSTIPAATIGILRHRRGGLKTSWNKKWESADTSADLSNGLTMQQGMQLITAYWDGTGIVRGYDGAAGSQRYLGFAHGESWTDGEVSYMRALWDNLGGGSHIVYWMGAQGNRSSNASYANYDYTKLPLKLRA